MRLVADAPAEDGALRAGVEIKLAPGWKTYWINPGPTGIPPRLDFTASENVASAQPLWPAPVRFTDGSSHAIGYAGRFIVPLRIEPKEADRPVRLNAVLDYGLCENICVPARAELALTLDPDTEADAFTALEIAGFAARVPRTEKLGGEEKLAITALARTEKGLGVSVRFPDDAKVTDLFASTPDGAMNIPRKTGPGTFRIDLGPQAPARFDLVAVADGAAIRVPVTLDLGGPTP